MKMSGYIHQNVLRETSIEFSLSLSLSLIYADRSYLLEQNELTFTQRDIIFKTIAPINHFKTIAIDKSIITNASDLK